MKRKISFKTRSRSKKNRSTRSKKSPFCSWKFFGGDAQGNTVRQTIYSTGNPNVSISQEGAKATLLAMNNMMK